MALSSDGTTVLVAVGAVGKTQAAVFAFHASSPHAWQSPARPTARLTNAADPAGFGSGVALSSAGSTALIGEPGGAAIFQVPTAASWRNSSTPTATLVATAAGAEVGAVSTSVALSADGTTALIGTTSDYTLAGAAYIFRTATGDAWLSSTTPEAALTDGVVGRVGDGFRGAVALSPDGRTALIGAPNMALGPSGAAYVFQVRTPKAWTTTADPDAVLERGSGDVPGWSVALSDEGTALVGEPSIFGRHGAADLFHVAESARRWRLGTVSQTTLTDAASAPRDLFGAAVALSSDGTTALVSSVRASLIFTRTGSRTASYCYVPYVTGEVMRSAKRAIESASCRVGKVSRISATRRRRGRVISQSPKPGARRAKYATVDLTVGRGRTARSEDARTVDPIWAGGPSSAPIASISS
jgi:hypothetical protein